MNLIKVLTYVLVFVLGAGCYYMYIRLKISKANADAKQLLKKLIQKQTISLKKQRLMQKQKLMNISLKLKKKQSSSV